MFLRALVSIEVSFSEGERKTGEEKFFKILRCEGEGEGVGTLCCPIILNCNFKNYVRLAGLDWVGYFSVQTVQSSIHSCKAKEERISDYSTWVAYQVLHPPYLPRPFHTYFALTFDFAILELFCLSESEKQSMFVRLSKDLCLYGCNFQFLMLI